MRKRRAAREQALRWLYEVDVGRTAVEEALFLMVMSYDKLGMAQLRDDADRVMRKNFPDSVYFRGGPEDDRPWWQLW